MTNSGVARIIQQGGGVKFVKFVYQNVLFFTNVIIY